MKGRVISNHDLLIVGFIAVIGLLVGLFWLREMNDFRGVTNLDKNREHANRWLSRGRSKDEVIREFGYPHNQTSDAVWVWLFDGHTPESERPQSVGRIEYRHDGLWIQFTDKKSSGPLRSISGNPEEYKQAVAGK